MECIKKKTRILADVHGLGAITVGQIWFADKGEIPWNIQELGLAMHISAIAMANNVNDIICEDFVLRVGRARVGNERSGLSAPRIAAMIQAFMAGRYFCPEWHWQQPGQALGLVTDERLKDWGGWAEGIEHGRSALKHAITAYRRGLI
jgi:hypothetical protein